MPEPTARRMWGLFEPVHMVTYFTPEARAAADRLGMRGFWMGYVEMRRAGSSGYGADRPLTLPTAHLSVDLHGGVDRDDWLQARALPGRTGRTLAFGYGEFTVAGRIIASVSAAFAVRVAGPEQPFPARPW